VWALRGTRVSATEVEALRRANPLQRRERRIDDCGWTPEGRVWIRVRLPRGSPSLVVGIPVSIKRYVCPGSYAAATVDGSHTSLIVADQGGLSWGYSRFLARTDADEGDVLVVEFDLVNQTASLWLDGAEDFGGLGSESESQLERGPRS